MNEQNLIPNSMRSPNEVRENGRKGGIASGKARKDNRTFRETLQALLQLADKDKEGKPLISPVTGKAMSIRENIVIQTISKARKGDLRAVNTILDVLGERVFEVNNNVNGSLKMQADDNRSPEEIIDSVKRLTALSNIIEREVTNEGGQGGGNKD